ncbi:MAG: hypothetical protein HY952_01240 [Elusimicrobia bacterium]|nr:hypothetical protein [Elusimicrobiota bacterium]
MRLTGFSKLLRLAAAQLLLWPYAAAVLPEALGAAEFEAPDRLWVDGSAVFRSSSTFEKQLAVGDAVVTSSLTVRGGVYVSTSASAGALFYVHDSTALVGVGTSVPSETLDVNGNLKAVRFIGEGKYITGVEGVPIGAIAFFDGACPANWSEYTPGQGRFLVANPSGGTIAGTLGTAFANLTDASFTPAGSVGSPVFTGSGGTSGSEAAHTHNMAHTHDTDIASFTSGSEASHTHSVSGTPSATWCTSRTAAACSGQADYGNAGNTFQASGTSAHTHGTSGTGSSHSHSVDPSSTASGNPDVSDTGAGSSHSHSFTPAGTNSSPAFAGTAESAIRSLTAPYIQFRLCQKTVGMGTAGAGWDDSGTYVFLFSQGDLVGIGTKSPEAMLTIAGGALQMNGTASPGGSAAATGRIYFDSSVNKFYVSENGGAYAYLVGASGLQGSGTSGRIPKFNTSTSLTDSALYETSSKIGVGRSPGAVGAATLELYGADASVAGPHLQTATSLDNYPVSQYLNWGHDNISLTMDGYFDGNWRSSDAGSNYQLRKISDAFSFYYAAGVGQGSVITWNTGVKLDPSGRVAFGSSLDTTVKTHVNGKLRVDQSAISVNGADMYLIPSGAMAFFDGSACPEGWSETTSVRTRAARGWDGSTAAGDANTGGADTHSHTTDIASFTSGSEASHTHSVSGTPSATWCTSRTAAACSGQADYGNAGNTFQASGTSAHTHGTSGTGSSHSHSVDPPSTASSTDGNLPAYRSFLTCKKN